MITQSVIDLAERGLVPTPALRLGIRAICRRRLIEQRRTRRPIDQWIREMSASPLALSTMAANEQHYEMPPAFFEQVLGPHLKYSGAYWPAGVTTLEQAEAAMLDMTIARAQLADGQRILELGCGWGSLTLEMARRFPHAHIHAVSNSRRQREFILDRASTAGLGNVTVETADMNVFEAPGRFDRVVSVEMFEHMRNWPALVGRIHRWLEPDGALFVHVFAHATFAYPYESAGDDDWMARHFFTGGMMPSDNLLPHVATESGGAGVPAPFSLAGHWTIDGTHYARTAEAWHRQLVGQRAVVDRILTAELGPTEARRAYHRWRLFFLACAELFGFRAGSEWIVSHYLLRPAVLERRS